MTKETRAKLAELKQRLIDFFWIYYDAKTAKVVATHPDQAIALIKESIADGLSSKGKLSVYAAAMSVAVEYQGLLASTNKKSTMS